MLGISPSEDRAGPQTAFPRKMNTHYVQTASESAHPKIGLDPKLHFLTKMHKKKFKHTKVRAGGKKEELRLVSSHKA